jgi:RimJ/RimL family protein N-acetyltransferase
MDKITFHETDFFGLLKIFKNFQHEIIELTDKLSPLYRSCFEPNIFIAYVNSTPIGFINLDIARCPNYNNFIDIWIRPEYRGKGFGFKILKEFDKIAPEILKKKKAKKLCIAATIHKSNIPSISIFEKAGYKRASYIHMQKLIERGVLGKDYVRYYKCF